MEITTIIEACKKDDKKAQYALYKELFSPLMNISSRYCTNREDAVSLFNDGFLKIILSLETYTPDKPFIAWAKRIMINTSIDKYRQNKNYYQNTSFYETDAHFEHDVHNTQEVESEADLEQINRCMDQLPKIERDVFNLFSIDGYSHQEICDLLQISERSSKRYLSNARTSLQNMLRKAVPALVFVLFFYIFKWTL
jgi:RNA polymerase sigma factor (sigma-70 family)